MKKKFLTISFAALSILSLAQNVGINTNTPQRRLDINGNLKVTRLADKSKDMNSGFLLAADRNTGNVDFIDINALQQTSRNNMEVGRSIYNAAAPDINKECSCGEIVLRFNGTNAEFKLKSEEVFTSNNNASDFKISYGIKRFTGSAYTYENKTDVSFTRNNPALTSHYDKFRAIDDTSFSADNSIRIYTLVLPKQANLYRITLSRFNNTATQKTYSLICEKFYLQNAQ
ncbi:hypothetical protein [Soonwooa sp.]|uniref:hypothetical protein n=1 Tax=Soonwooa sp. TaxID=1938592 RepID=UPI002636AB3E|nr:hypothetical protein [Soonwooa sp.]